MRKRFVNIRKNSDIIYYDGPDHDVCYTYEFTYKRTTYQYEYVKFDKEKIEIDPTTKKEIKIPGIQWSSDHYCAAIGLHNVKLEYTNEKDRFNRKPIDIANYFINLCDLCSKHGDLLCDDCKRRRKFIKKYGKRL